LRKDRVSIKFTTFSSSCRVKSVIHALHTGGAARLNGCFAVEREPNMISYLANHAVPIELSLTNLYSKCFTTISDTENALRLFFDKGLKIAPCSLDLSLYPQSRNEMMYKMAHKANFTIREVVTWIMFSFTAASLNHDVKRNLFKEALEETKDLLAQMGLQVDI
jgi:adenosine deaminase